MKKLEKQVKENSLALEKVISKYMEEHKDKYAIYHNGAIDFVDNFGAAVKKGIETYGEDTGFVVKKITNLVPVLSSLVKF